MLPEAQGKAFGCPHVPPIPLPVRPQCEAPFDIPFSKATKQVLQMLDNTAQLKGGPRTVLTKLKDVAHNTYLKEFKNLFDNDMEDVGMELGTVDYGNNQYSDCVLECIRHVMMVKRSIQASSIKGHQCH